MTVSTVNLYMERSSINSILCNVDINYSSPVVCWHCHGVKGQIETLATAETVFKTALAAEREKKRERERERER